MKRSLLFFPFLVVAAALFSLPKASNTLAIESLKLVGEHKPAGHTYANAEAFVDSNGDTVVDAGANNYVDSNGVTYVNAGGNNYVDSNGNTYVNAGSNNYVDNNGNTYVNAGANNYVDSNGSTYVNDGSPFLDYLKRSHAAAVFPQPKVEMVAR